MSTSISETVRAAKRLANPDAPPAQAQNVPTADEKSPSHRSQDAANNRCELGIVLGFLVAGVCLALTYLYLGEFMPDKGGRTGQVMGLVFTLPSVFAGVAVYHTVNWLTGHKSN